jgi:lycopene cyclase domain-containing protein
MSYWALNAIFLIAVLAVALAAVLWRHRRGPVWASVGLTASLLVLLTALFDNIMIGVGLVGYSARLIGGAFIGMAPFEDFAYPIAAAVLLPAVWCLIPSKKSPAP